MADRKAVRPTMGDVAERAGVSQMTVSRVLSGKGYISSKVRDQVHAAASEIGYVQNHLARGLRSEQSSLIAVVLPTLGNTVFTEVLRGITDGLTAQSYRPVFGLTEYSQAREYEMVRDLLSWRPAGIVLAGLEHSDDTRRAIEASGVRVAQVMDIDGDPISTAFGFSQHDAGRVTAQHMLARGHRRFVYVGSQGRSDLRAAKRLAGFRRTVNEAGGVIMAERIGTLPSSMAEGRRMTAEILSGRDRPDAIYYSNDDLAAGGIMQCLAEGISIPGDIAMAGFNGLPYLDALPIQLTTIKTPRYDIGLQAGQRLAMPQDTGVGNAPRLVDLGFELSIGETC